ncbi:TPA: CopG family transcriptional regulator [Neisseria gonorrhoeae]|jgi:predicted DNA-binding protein
MSDQKKKLQATLAKETFDVLENLSKKLGVTKSAIVTLAIKNYSLQIRNEDKNLI